MISTNFPCSGFRCEIEYLSKFSGCPECARHYCPTCASDLAMICKCGGELKDNNYFQLWSCSKLPEEIIQYKSLKRRIKTLNEIRPLYNLIEAEYNEYKRIIIKCERRAREAGTEVQDNLGAYLLSSALEGVLHCVEATILLIKHVIPSNVDQLLNLLADDYYMKEIRTHLDAYPKTDDEWEELKGKNKIISLVNSNAILIPEDCAAKSWESDRNSVQLLRKHLPKQ